MALLFCITIVPKIILPILFILHSPSKTDQLAAGSIKSAALIFSMDVVQSILCDTTILRPLSLYMAKVSDKRR